MATLYSRGLDLKNYHLNYLGILPHKFLLFLPNGFWVEDFSLFILMAKKTLNYGSWFEQKQCLLPKNASSQASAFLAQWFFKGFFKYTNRCPIILDYFKLKERVDLYSTNLTPFTLRYIMPNKKMLAGSGENVLQTDGKDEQTKKWSQKLTCLFFVWFRF